MLSGIAKRRRSSSFEVLIRSRNFWGEIWDFPNSVQTIRLLIAEGNLVAVWATYEGTQQGSMGPFPPSGRKCNLTSEQYSASRAGRSQSGG